MLEMSDYAKELFRDATPCRYCGEPVIYSAKDAVYIHRWGRWQDDNGYYCTEERTTSALGS